MSDARPSRSGRQLSLVSNSLNLVAAKVGTMGLGFVFWLVAARLFARDEVGIAAAVVSAMMACTQLALLGLGSSVIVEYPRHQRAPRVLLDSAQTIVTVVAVLASLGFLALAATMLDLGVVTSSAGYALLFVAASVLGTLGVLFDQVFTAMRRGDQVLVRGACFGLVTVVALVAIAVAAPDAGSEAIFLPWVVGGVAMCSLAVIQLRGNVPGYRPRAALDRDMSRGLMARGLPNWGLTLAERMPGYILPVVVVQLLSPSANAAWYAAWMMAWVVYFVPIQVGMGVFAEISHAPERLSAIVRQGVLTSLGVSVVGALAVAAGAHLALSILGHGYAADGTVPLRLLVIGVVPATFTYVYFAACRATDRLREGLACGWTLALASVVGAVVVAPSGGLEGMATAWVVVQCCVGAWSAWRLRAMARAPTRVPSGAVEPPVGVAATAGPVPF